MYHFYPVLVFPLHWKVQEFNTYEVSAANERKYKKSEKKWEKRMFFNDF